jgi:hypothetical protein
VTDGVLKKVPEIPDFLQDMVLGTGKNLQIHRDSADLPGESRWI